MDAAFEDQAVVALMALRGVSVTLTTPAGSASTITAVMRIGAAARRTEEDGRIDHHDGVAIVAAADGDAIDLSGWTITHDGDTWVVAAILHGNRGYHRLGLRRTAAGVKARRDQWLKR